MDEETELELSEEAIKDTFYTDDGEFVVLNNELLGDELDKDVLMIGKVVDGRLQVLTQDEYIVAAKKYLELQDIFNEDGE